MAIKLVRSPRYPVIGLPEAIERVRAVYRADNRNRIPKILVAEHMGYQGLNGKSLGIISAVSKYGLLDGNVDAMGVTPLAVDILEREPDDPERATAIRTAARNVDLYNEIDEAFPAKASDSAIRSFLITKRAFLPDSAERLIRSYRETQALVDGLEDAPSLSLPADGSAVVSSSEPPIVAQQGASGVIPVSNAGRLADADEREWLRGPLSRTASYRLIVSGDMGPREIGKLIKLLEAQKAVLDDEEEE
ncbi:hypothetical protein [uncultured Sphingomonas sp.]|uniref:hypothetical protein n=1 Tax=uncultured Sphingomonas sp. TaxID=158754 RepID=UPI0030F5012C